MEKNYYDILEVNKNASPEVIEKAYKTLVKKYHPDLQTISSKEDAENKMKELNEAYEILSNPDKRKAYNFKLDESEKESKSKAYKEEETEHQKQEYNDYSQQNVHNENYSQQNVEYKNHNQRNSEYQDTTKINDTNNIQNQQINNEASINNNKEFEKQLNISKQQIFNQMKAEQLKYGEEMKNAISKAYYDAYIQDLKNRGYKIKYKKGKKDYIRIIATFFAVIIVLFLLYQIPVIKNFLYSFYKENEIIHTIVDIFSNIIKQILDIFKKT